MGRWNVVFRLIGVGFYIGGSIVLGVLVGLWLDSRLNTGSILVIVGLVFGLFIAFYGVYRMLLLLIGNKGKKGDS